MGEGVAFGGLAFPGTGYHVPNIGSDYLVYMINIWNTVSAFIHLECFCPRTFFSNNGLDKTFIF